MVENSVREEVVHLRRQIASEKNRSDIIKNWIWESENIIEFYKAALEHSKKMLDHARGTNDEEEAAEAVENIKSWLKKYEEMLPKNEKDAHISKERLKELEVRLKELVK